MEKIHSPLHPFHLVPVFLCRDLLTKVFFNIQVRKGNFVVACLIWLVWPLLGPGTGTGVDRHCSNLLLLQVKRLGFCHHCLSHVVACWEMWLPWSFINCLNSFPSFTQFFSLPLGVPPWSYVTLVGTSFTYPGTCWAQSLL